MPVFASTPAVFPAAVAVPDGAVLSPLTCAVPVEPEAVLPPPTCAVPVELEALLPPPPPTVTGAEAATVEFPTAAPPPAPTVAGDACTVPVELDALLLPAVPPAGLPVGAATVAAPAGEATLAVGLAVTAPIWAVPIEFVAVFPGSASAGAAVPTAHKAAARPMSMRFTMSSLSRVD
jgi:hypothetical protein